jgi:tetratricopeptide (TPR) repeat protein
MLSTVTGAQDVSLSARSRINAARAQLQAGDYAGARVEYLMVFGMSPTSAEARDAYFGVAFAGQMLIRAGTQEADVTVDRVASEYESALRGAAPVVQQNVVRNRGLLFRDAGRHDAAIAEFRRLIRLLGSRGANSAELANALWNMGLSLEAMERFGDADRAFSDALRADATFKDARRARLSLAMRLGAIDTTLSLARAFRLDSTLAPQITEALLRILERPPSEIRVLHVDQAMEELAWNLTVREIGADYFQMSLDTRIRGILARSAATQKGLVAIGEAYTWRPDAPYRITPAASWWLNSFDRQAAWSALMRTIGDYWRQQPGSMHRARAYYEASLSSNDDRLHEWSDRRALEPLGVIYARTRDSAQAERIDRMVEQETNAELSRAVDSAQVRKLTALHNYHATLGRIYSRGPDSATTGARRAEKHVESIKKIGDRIETTGRPRPLPPSELLIDVAKRADARGDIATATTVTNDLSKSLSARGREDLARAVVEEVKVGTRSVPGRGAAPPLVIVPPTGRVGAAATISTRIDRAGARFDSLTRADAQQLDSLRTEMNGVSSLLNTASNNPRFRTVFPAWRDEFGQLSTRARSVTAALRPETLSEARRLIFVASERKDEASLVAAEVAVDSLGKFLDDRHRQLRSIRAAAAKLRSRMTAAMG